MENLTLFIALTAAAVALQAGILVAMYLALRKTSARVEGLAAALNAKLLPAADTAHAMMVELRPLIQTAVSNISESSQVVRAQIGRIDATVNDVIDRTRLQVIRADELVNRTLDRVEDATNIVHHSVVSPVRQLSGLLQGLTVGLEALFGGKRRRREDVTVPQDEMFI